LVARPVALSEIVVVSSAASLSAVPVTRTLCAVA
jgi:hypothetical protein